MIDGDAGGGGAGGTDTVADGSGRSDEVLVPGARDVRGTLDRADGGVGAEPDACVVACPPHPQHRGHRGDERIVAVSEAVRAAGVDCLRFDYGEWAEGRGERTDVRNAVEWAAERYARVGLFGFSFGATLALVVGSERDDLRAVAALAPTARIGGEAGGDGDTDAADGTDGTVGADSDGAADLDAVAAVSTLADRGTAVRVVHGERDDTADWEPVVAAARAVGFEVVSLPADHFFVGQSETVAERVGGYLTGHLAD
jgi:alpha/beta superfamily hydrolase